MRKQLFCFKASFILLLCIGLHLSLQAQRPTRTPISAEQAKEFEKSKTAEELKLSAAEQKEGAERAQMMVAYLVKAMLHRVDPAAYPLDDDAKSPERVALKAVENISPATLARAKTKLTAFASDEPRKAKVLGKFKSIDFKKKSITPEIKKSSNIQFRPVPRAEEEGTALQDEQSITPLVGAGGALSPNDPTKPAYTKMDWILRAVHCIDETNPESGNDDIVVGGLLIGASGNTKSANTLISCKFNDGGYCNHGAYPFGTVSLTTTNSYPKIFYLILQLVEVDSDEREAAAVITDIMNSAGNLAGGTYGAIIAALSQAIGAILGLFFDDDLFPQRSIVMHLGGENVFGPDGRSNNWHTSNINGHGGTYRVGFYCQLR